jgi:hypothetical protein
MIIRDDNTQYYSQLTGVIAFIIPHSFTWLRQNISPIAKWQILNTNPNQ